MKRGKRLGVSNITTNIKALCIFARCFFYAMKGVETMANKKWVKDVVCIIPGDSSRKDHNKITFLVDASGSLLKSANNKYLCAEDDA